MRRSSTTLSRPKSISVKLMAVAWMLLKSLTDLPKRRLHQMTKAKNMLDKMITRKKTGVMDRLTVSTRTEIRGTRSARYCTRAP